MNHTDGIDEIIQDIAIGFSLSSGNITRPNDGVGSRVRSRAKQAIEALFLKDLQELMGQKETVYRPKTYTVVYNQDGDTEKREGMEFTDAIPLSAVEALIEKYRSEK